MGKTNLNKLLRTKPKIWHPCYFVTKNSLKTFLKFKSQINKNKKSIKVLDAGCGFKVYDEFFKKGEYIGIDYSKKNSNADVIGSITELTFEDNYFDAIICSEVLEHIFEFDRAINEIKRVCKPEGLIYLSTPFMFPEHGGGVDYFRYTKYFYKKKFSKIQYLSPSNSALCSPILNINIFLDQFKIPFLAPIYFINNILIFILENISKIFRKIGSLINKKKQMEFILFGSPMNFSMIIKNEK